MQLRRAALLADVLYASCAEIFAAKTFDCIFMFHGFGQARQEMSTGELSPRPHSPRVFEAFIRRLRENAIVCSLDSIVSEHGLLASTGGCAANVTAFLCR